MVDEIRVRDVGGLTVVEIGDVRITVERDGLKMISPGDRKVVFEYIGSGGGSGVSVGPSSIGTGGGPIGNGGGFGG